jgi:hypothetical protein
MELTIESSTSSANSIGKKNNTEFEQHVSRRKIRQQWLEEQSEFPIVVRARESRVHSRKQSTNASYGQAKGKQV